MAERRWSPGETAALIEAWMPLYNRRRGGQSDVWVPHHQRGRARSFRRLVSEDWRAVAAAVNGYRAVAGLSPDRTPDQCKWRMSLLRRFYGSSLSQNEWWNILPGLGDAGADGGVGNGGAGVGAAADGRWAAPDARGSAAPAAGGAAAGDARGHEAAVAAVGRAAMAAARGAGVGTAADGRRDAPGDARRSAAPAAGGAAAGDARGHEAVVAAVGSAMAMAAARGAAAAAGEARGYEAVAAAAGAAMAAALGGSASATWEGRGTTMACPRGLAATDEGAAAASDLLGAPIPKRPRTGCSTSAGAGGAPSVKEELVRRANAVRGGDDARGAAADGIAAAVATLAAAGSADAAVMLGYFYKQIMKLRAEEAARGAVDPASLS